MTTGGIELTFATTTKDWARVQSLLNGLALRRENMLLYILTHKVMTGAARTLVSGVCILTVIYFLPKLLARDVGEILNATTILMLVLVGWALWKLGRSLWQMAAKTLASEESSRTGREGVHWGRHHLLATAESLSVRLSARHSVYSWSAFLGVKKTKDLLLLQLTPSLNYS